MVSLTVGSLVGLLLMGGPARCDEIVNPSETTRSQLAGSSWELLLLDRNGHFIRPSTGGERITLRLMLQAGTSAAPAVATLMAAAFLRTPKEFYSPALWLVKWLATRT